MEIFHAFWRFFFSLILNFHQLRATIQFQFYTLLKFIRDDEIEQLHKMK